MQRIILAILTGLWGTAVVATILFPSPFELWLPSSALFGATAAGYLLAPLLTKPGLLWPIATAVLLTTLGASLAGGAALFFAVGIACGLIGNLGVNGTARNYAAGFGEMIFAGVIVGLSRSVYMILQDASIIDPIILAFFEPLKSLPRCFF